MHFKPLDFFYHPKIIINNQKMIHMSSKTNSYSYTLKPEPGNSGERKPLLKEIRHKTKIKFYLRPNPPLK